MSRNYFSGDMNIHDPQYHMFSWEMDQISHRTSHQWINRFEADYFLKGYQEIKRTGVRTHRNNNIIPETQIIYKWNIPCKIQIFDAVAAHKKMQVHRDMKLAPLEKELHQLPMIAYSPKTTYQLTNSRFWSDYKAPTYEEDNEARMALMFEINAESILNQIKEIELGAKPKEKNRPYKVSERHFLSGVTDVLLFNRPLFTTQNHDTGKSFEYDFNQ